MLTTKEKILSVLRKIEAGEYGRSLLGNIDDLRVKVSTDIGSADQEEGMAIVGYLLNKKYIHMDPQAGFVLTDDPKTKQILREMIDEFVNNKPHGQ